MAVKPDMVFLWDEAWFAFAAFSPVYKQRTAMYAAGHLSRKYKSKTYREAYEQAKDKGKCPTPIRYKFGYTPPNPPIKRFLLFGRAL